MDLQHPMITRLELLGIPKGDGCANCGECFGELVYIYKGARLCSKNCLAQHLIDEGAAKIEYNDEI